MNNQPKLVKRSKLIVVLTALIIPPVAMLYIGRGMRAIIYSMIGIILTEVLTMYMDIPKGTGTGISAAVVIDAFYILNKTNNTVEEKWYTKWYVIASLVVASIGYTYYLITL